jgi:hypothetical protein
MGPYNLSEHQVASILIPLKDLKHRNVALPIAECDHPAHPSPPAPDSQYCACHRHLNNAYGYGMRSLSPSHTFTLVWVVIRLILVDIVVLLPFFILAICVADPSLRPSILRPGDSTDNVSELEATMDCTGTVRAQHLGDATMECTGTVRAQSADDAISAECPQWVSRVAKDETVRSPVVQHQPAVPGCNDVSSDVDASGAGGAAGRRTVAEAAVGQLDLHEWSQHAQAVQQAAQGLLRQGSLGSSPTSH